MPTVATLTADFLEAHPVLKLAGVVLGLALLRDHPSWRWLRYPLLPVAMSGAAYRVKAVLRGSGPTAADTSLLDWVLRQLPGAGGGAAAGAAPGGDVVAVVVRDLLGLALLCLFVQWARALRRALTDWRATKARLGDWAFSLLRELPPVRRKLEEETVKLEATIQHSLRPHGWLMGHAPIRALPATGLVPAAVRGQLRGYAAKEEEKWIGGFVSGAVYGGEEEIVSLMGEAATLYGLSNPLHPDLFGSVMRFESEICAMVCDVVGGGDPGVCACLTSGGTESIILAAKAHRNYYREVKGVGSSLGSPGEIVACVSAHAAIQKAADLMGLRLVLVPMDPATFQVDLAAMERAITSSTILLYASAPSFAQGVIDPVEAIGALGVKYDVGVHVDCCLGGFILPFARRLGPPFSDALPRFDFSVPGVTSMSVDTHKYGYAAKGTSVVVYRHKQLRHHQFFCFADWRGGLYVTPTIAGSRPGALSAACWAAMVAIGREGYEARARQILETTRTIAEGVKAIPGLVLQGQAQAMIVCVGGAPGVNIYQIGDRMTKKGWNLNSLQGPPGIHLCVTLRHVGRQAAFLKDLREAAAEVVAEVEAEKVAAAAANGKATKKKEAGNAAIYGMASTLPAGPVNDMLRTYMDVVLS